MGVGADLVRRFCAGGAVGSAYSQVPDIPLGARHDAQRARQHRVGALRLRRGAPSLRFRPMSPAQSMRRRSCMCVHACGVPPHALRAGVIRACERLRACVPEYTHARTRPRVHVVVSRGLPCARCSRASSCAFPNIMHVFCRSGWLGCAANLPMQLARSCGRQWWRGGEAPCAAGVQAGCADSGRLLRPYARGLFACER